MNSSEFSAALFPASPTSPRKPSALAAGLLLLAGFAPGFEAQAAALLIDDFSTTLIAPQASTAGTNPASSVIQSGFTHTSLTNASREFIATATNPGGGPGRVDMDSNTTTPDRFTIANNALSAGSATVRYTFDSQDLSDSNPNAALLLGTAFVDTGVQVQATIGNGIDTITSGWYTFNNSGPQTPFIKLSQFTGAPDVYSTATSLTLDFQGPQGWDAQFDFVSIDNPIPSTYYDSGPITTALTSLSLGGTGDLPLGRGPANVNNGYELVHSQIDLSLSSERAGTPGPASTGTARLTGFATGPNGEVQNGDILNVESFFDVYFDTRIEDIDGRAGYDFAAPSGDMANGTVLDGSLIPSLYGQGPAHMVLEPATCVADVSKPNYGCLPPVFRTYTGHMTSRIELGFDVNGLSTDPNAFDVVKFTLASHILGGTFGSFVSGSKAVDNINTTAFLQGSVSDALVDPPFSISLEGPVTAEQQIVVQAAVPEPTSFALLSLGLFGLARRRAA